MFGKVRYSQNSQQRVKDTKADCHRIQQVHRKLKNFQRKLSETEEKLDTDDDEQKKELVGDLKKRAIVSLKAMNAHSESYNKVMEATVKASGARLNKELAVVEERTSRYVFVFVSFSFILFYFKYRILHPKNI